MGAILEGSSAPSRRKPGGGGVPLGREGRACFLTTLSLKLTPTQQGPGSPGGG